MDDIRLRTYDGVALASFLCIPWLLFTGPTMLARQSHNGAWIALIASHFAMMLVFLIVVELMRYHRGKDLITAAQAAVGRPVGALYGLLLAVYLCLSTGFFVRECAETFKAYGLSITPIYVIAGLIVVCAVAMNLFGGKSIIKSTSLFFIVILLGVLFIMVLGLNRYNTDYLFPVLGYGQTGIANSSQSAACMIEGVIILALFAPAFSGTAQLRKSGLLALLVCAVVSVAFYLCLMMMFSAPVILNMTSGFMEMGKSIYYNRFFYRFESALLFFLIFAAVLSASLGLFAARKSAGAILGAHSHRALTLACSVLILAVALVPANMLELSRHFFAGTRRYSIFFMAGVPVLLFIISSVKRMFKHES